MKDQHLKEKNNKKLSIVIPCFNEENTIEKCVTRVLKIADDYLSLEIIIIDDNSTDNSFKVMSRLATKYQEISVHQHSVNQGKGAALRTGFAYATGDYVAVQDADLEYDPQDLKRLIIPLQNGYADVVFGSRFATQSAHRVLYFWHSLGNKFLTLLSNIFTDLNLTDMETCYKVFKRNVIQNIEIIENRFGFEPEIVAKIAQRKLRIYEMGISYHGRTYNEGKKIGYKDGLRALYCIFHYNAHKAPVPIQLIIYLFIGAIVACANYILFMSLYNIGLSINITIPVSFIIAAIINYFLCISILFKHKARWTTTTELFIYIFFAAFIGSLDFTVTKYFFELGNPASESKITAIVFLFFMNFIGGRFIVFPTSNKK